MANTMEKSPNNLDEQEEQEDQTLEELGLDPRLIRALTKKGIEKPTPIQRVAIPLILEGKDVVARAKTGSGKTFAYLLPLLQKLFSDSASKMNLAPAAFILVPTRELCQQVYSEILSLIELCRVQLKVVQVMSTMSASDLRTALAGSPQILVSTPTCIHTCLSAGVLQSKSVQDSLSILILDEADLLLSYGYEDDLKALTPHVPRRCQCLLMSATSSADIEKLKKLILHNPYILTSPEVGEINDEIVPKNVQQFWIRLEVINFEMPQSAAEYVHRIGCTGRAYNTGASVSFVSPKEMEIFEEIKSILGEKESKDSNFIAPFPLLSKNAVEFLRYRAEDVARSVTKIAVRESRAQDLRNEIINSEKLKAHFQNNSKDFDLLKHDKVLSKKAPAPHLRDVPEYLLDPTTQEASKIVKLARATMGRNTNSGRHKGFKGKNRDPLKTFSAEAPKRASKGWRKRKRKGGDDGHKHKKQSA